MLFEVKVTEVLSRRIVVKASSEEEAKALVEKLYADEEIVLDAEDFTGTVYIENTDRVPKETETHEYDAKDYVEEI